MADQLSQLRAREEEIQKALDETTPQNYTAVGVGDNDRAAAYYRWYSNTREQLKKVQQKRKSVQAFVEGRTPSPTTLSNAALRSTAPPRVTSETTQYDPTKQEWMRKKAAGAYLKARNAEAERLNKQGYRAADFFPSAQAAQPSAARSAKGFEGFREAFVTNLTPYGRLGFGGGTTEYATSTGTLTVTRSPVDYPASPSTRLGFLGDLRAKGFSPIGYPVTRGTRQRGKLQARTLKTLYAATDPVGTLAAGVAFVSPNSQAADYLYARRRLGSGFDVAYSESLTANRASAPLNTGNYWNVRGFQQGGYDYARSRGLSEDESNRVFRAFAVERGRRVGSGFYRLAYSEVSGEAAGRVAIAANIGGLRKIGVPVSRMAVSRMPWLKRFGLGASGGVVGGAVEGTTGYLLETDTLGGDLTGKQLAGGALFGASFAGLATGGYVASQTSRYARVRGIGTRVDRGLKLYDYPEALGDELVDYASRYGRARVVVPGISGRSPVASSTGRVASAANINVQSRIFSRSTVSANAFVSSRNSISSRSNILTRSNIGVLSRSDVVSRNAVNVLSRSNVNSRVAVLSRSNVSARSSVPVNVPVPAGRGFPFLLPGSLGGRRRGGFLGGSRRGFSYAPSLAAIDLGIRGRARTPKGGFTGLEFRPLPGLSGRRRKRR